MLFFLLSGFVISYSSEERTKKPGGTQMYLLHRFRRIYPLFLLSLLVTYCSDSWISGRFSDVDFKTLIGNVLMLQDIDWLKRGAWIAPFGGNEPLWSLSYEWWFYILFLPLLKWIRFESQFQFALLFSVCMALSYSLFPTPVGLIGGYFFIWWSGVEMAREFKTSHAVSIARQWRTILGLVLLALAVDTNWHFRFAKRTASHRL